MRSNAATNGRPSDAFLDAIGDRLDEPPHGVPRVIIGTTADPPVLSREPVAALDRRAEERGAPVLDVVSGPLEVRLAGSAADIDAVQALRYRIFYETMGARPSRLMARSRRDSDPFDENCDHLMVLDHSRGVGADAVVGTYRLIGARRRGAAAGSTRPRNTTSRAW